MNLPTKNRTTSGHTVLQALIIVIAATAAAAFATWNIPSLLPPVEPTVPVARPTLKRATPSGSDSTSLGMTLDVVITGLEPDGSYLRLEVLDGPEQWRAPSKPLASLRARVHHESMRLTLHGLPAGRLGVRLYQDLNGNGQLDKNMLGIPTEGWGYSGDADLMGPPSFDDAAFELGPDQATIAIAIR